MLCTTPFATHGLQGCARCHVSFAVYCLRQAVPSAQAWAWDKVAQMVKVLDETPPEQAEWILFMQPDTVIDDVAFTFPFEFYQVHDGRNLAHQMPQLVYSFRGPDMGPVRRARTLSRWAMDPSCWRETPQARCVMC